MQRKCPECGYAVDAETQAALVAAGSNRCLNCGYEFAEEESNADQYVRREFARVFAAAPTYRTAKYWVIALLASLLATIRLIEKCG